MKCVFQRFRDGTVEVADVAPPRLKQAGVLVQTAFSAVSPGTEGMKVQLGRKSLVQKARQRPDQVALVLNTLREQGPAATYRKVRSKLDTPEALGYSSAGTVIEAGPGVLGLAAGTRVACAGPGAHHAEIASVAQTFCVPVPDHVALEEAAFAGLGAIALEAFHQARVQVGEAVGVIGLGLVGQLLVQVARASGARVLGVDVDPGRVELARSLGAHVALVRATAGLEDAVSALTAGRGLDAVLVAAATSSSDPLVLAGQLAAPTGRVVLVGAVPIELPRKDYYEKQLRFQVSRAFGAGSYDPAYESGLDYPSGGARWTARANLETFVQLLADGTLRVSPLVSERMPVDAAPRAYDLVAGSARPLGILFEYQPAGNSAARPPAASPALPAEASRAAGIAFVGAGSFAQAYLLPAVKARAGVKLATVATASGITATQAARKFGFARATSEDAEAIADPEVGVVFVATRHDQHARLTVAALAAGKHVFVEKPLAVTTAQLDEVAGALRGSKAVLAVGYNRRFSRAAVEARRALAGIEAPMQMHYRVNAGAIPADHWVLRPEQGGRIIGEACHFVDLLSHLCRALPVRVYAEALPAHRGSVHQNVQALITFAGGSVGHLEYSANGPRGIHRERIEVLAGGMGVTIDDFRGVEVVRGGRARAHGGRSQDLGHAAGVNAFLDAASSQGPPPIPYPELWAGALATILIEDSIRAGRPLEVAAWGSSASGTPEYEDDPVVEELLQDGNAPQYAEERDGQPEDW